MPARHAVTVAAPTGADGRFVIPRPRARPLSPARHRHRLARRGGPLRTGAVGRGAHRGRRARSRSMARSPTAASRSAARPSASAATRSAAASSSRPIPRVRSTCRTCRRAATRCTRGKARSPRARCASTGSAPARSAPRRAPARSRAIVVGRVIDREEGTGLVAAIELRPSGDDQAPRYARSGDDGVFRIEGVPNGRWIADAFAPGLRVGRRCRARGRARRARARSSRAALRSRAACSTATAIRSPAPPCAR